MLALSRLHPCFTPVIQCSLATRWAGKTYPTDSGAKPIMGFYSTIGNMRTALSLTLLLIVTTLSTLAGVHAEAPSDGTTVIISADETWNGTNTMNGNLIVESGATLTIEGDVTLATGNSITVEEGATLTVTGSLLGEELDSGLAVFDNPQSKTQLHMNFAETGQLRINFDQTIPTSAIFNMTIGDQTVDAAGKDHIFIDVTLNGSDLLADFHIYYAFEIQIISVQALHSGSAQSPILSASELNHTNGSLIWNSASFALDVQGTLHLDGATLYGAELTCSGVCEMHSSTLIGSAPINVDDGTSIVVNSSSILGSRTDEDIIVHDLAEITYTDNQGTGGVTDGWIRLLSQRQIQTNAGNITVHQTGIGYGGSTRDDFTDSNGLIDIGGSEWLSESWNGLTKMECIILKILNLYSHSALPGVTSRPQFLHHKRLRLLSISHCRTSKLFQLMLKIQLLRLTKR